MPSLKDLRNRIASVRSTQKITQAMQMVAAAKLRRAQDAAEAARPYAERMGRVLESLGANMAERPDAHALLSGTGRMDNYLLVVATAERGLCGAFNSSITRHARQRADALLNAGKNVRILCIGTKGFDILKRQYGALIVDTVSFKQVRNVGYTEASQVASRVLEMFDKGEFDVCLLFYSAFRSVISQIPTEKQLIPARLEGAEADQRSDPDLQGAIYEYEPDEKEILADLLPRNVAVQIFHALLENAASEQGARMSAMDNATRNAGEMIDDLTISYNRSRQAIITKELMEIIGGAEALKG